MMSLRRIFGLMLLFFFFEAVVAVVTTFAYPAVNVFLACVAMTALALGVWAVFILVARLTTRSRVPHPVPAPKPAVPIPARTAFANDSYSQELEALISEANRRLAGTMPANQRGEPPTIATLPLYLVIGGEGAGKTCAILNSGLEPRLLAGEALREASVIPTRLCNLWFVEGSVFADISGRTLTQESENWERALRVFSQPSRIPRWKQVLFGRQTKSNLKGILLVCDASQFVRSSDPQRSAAFARMLGDRLQAAGSVFRREFPVYVVFSKCDGVQYFPEFFAHLSEPEGRRLMGVTLPYLKLRNDTADIYADREGKRLTECFNRLYMSLAEKRLVLLAREDEAAKKSTAYEFARELKKLRGDVVQFLLDVFRPNPLQVGPRLRGFYFCGQRWVARNLALVGDDTMTGTIMPKRADATVFFGSQPAASQPVRPAMSSGAVAKWIFLTDLFHNVILKDRAGYVARVPHTREQEYRNFALAGVGTLLLLLCLAWANSWRHNRNLLNSVETAVQEVRVYRSDTSYEDGLEDLDILRVPLVTLLQYERQGAPLSYRWGLYSGSHVAGTLSNLYFDRFRKLFMDPIQSSLTTRFLQLESSLPVSDDIYSLLKAYRMITSGACKPDAAFLGNTVLPIWSNALSLAPSDAGAVADRQVQFYISELLIKNPYEQTISENSKAVANAQTYLRESNGPDKILRSIVDSINREGHGDTLSNYAPNYGDVLTGPNAVDAAYTPDGWDSVIDNIRGHKLESSEDSCVIGSGSKIAGMKYGSESEREVEELYISNYIQRWTSFVAAHHVEPFHGSSDGAQKLRILADNNRSPLLGLVYMAAHNTNLTGAPLAESTLQALGEGAKNKFKSEVVSLFGKSNGSANQQAASAVTLATGPTANEVVNAFLPLRVVTDPANHDKWINANNQPYVQALAELGDSLAGLPAKNDAKDSSNQQAFDRANKALNAARTAYNSLGATIPNSSSGVDVDLKTLLLEPITYARRVVDGVPVQPPPPPPPDLTIPIRKQVNQSAQALCQSVETLRVKYPFDPGSSQEATIQDLNIVFAPTGSLALFSQSPDVAKTYLRQGRAWAQNPAFPATYSPSFLGTLNDLTAFSDAFYGDGGANPHFDYTLTLDGTGHVPAVLEIDGHSLVYNPKKGPAIQKLVWPPTTNGPTRLTVKAGMSLHLENTGQWSLFRLLQTADKQVGDLFVFSTVQLANGNKSPLQDSKGNPVTVQIRVDSPAANTFGKSYFGKLRCENPAGWALR